MFCCAHIISISNANTNSTTHLCQQPRKPLTHSEIKILKNFQAFKKSKKSVKLLYNVVKGLYTFGLFQAECLHLLVERRTADVKNLCRFSEVMP